MAVGNKHLGYKEALNTIEAASPGTKHDFYFGFLARASEHFTPTAEDVQDQLRTCSRCGAPTTGEVCAFCRLVERATMVPVALGRKSSR
jgi:tRNA-5-methyluridine54 2-sulfurtransferase